MTDIRSGGTAMTMPRLVVALTILNLGLLVLLLAQVRPPEASSAAPVLRGRMLEIVDDRGRVRASIKVQPAGTADGTPYPETVILRLIDPNGRPFVKLAGSERGAGLGLLGESDTTHVLLKAEGPSTTVKLTNGDGRQHLIEPR
jgi:hypothetical protein